MSRHEETVFISKETYDRINRLLAIESLENMTDSELLKYGANTNQYEGVYCVTFDDNSTLTFDLCSGTSNYWDNIVWKSADEKHEVVPDCEYRLDDVELKIDSEIYSVKIHKGE